MKRILAFLLAALMVLALCACGAEPPAEPAAPAAPAEAPAAPAEAPVAPAEGSVADDPQVTLVAATAFTSTQLPGIFWDFFKAKVEELSGGSILIDLYNGATMCGPDEELGMLSNGSIDMMMAFIPANAFSLPCIGSIYYTPASIADTQDALRYILFEEPASAAAVAEAFAANNATLLPSCVVTSDIVFASKKPVTCWADMYEGKFGCPMDANYTDMGYKNLVTVIDSDWYESLRTGLCDSIQATAADVVSSKIYEVAEYYLVCPANRVDHFMTINTDSYNSLTEGQREVLLQACDALMEYSIEVEDDLTAQFESLVKENGGTILQMTDEEFEWFLYCGDVLGWQTGLETLAVMTNCVPAMEAVQNATKEAYNKFTDFNFDELAAKYAQ